MTDYGYDDFDEDDDEEEFDEDQYILNWQAEFVNNAQILQNQLGRQLTNREVDTLADMLEDEDYPDVQGAYESYYSQVEDKEPNLDNPQSRQEYMAERMTEHDEAA